MPRLIDADGHVNEVPVYDQYIPLIERPYRDRVRQSAEEPRRLDIDGEAWPKGKAARVTEQLIVRDEGPLATWHERPACAGMWDPHARMKDMDLDGIDVAVLFPGVIGLAAPGHPDRGMAAALTRAYNDWLATYCRPYADRLKGCAALPFQDIEASVEELRRSVTELGFVGAMLPNRPPHVDRNLDDPVYEPLWNEAQRLDVPICIHNNTIYQTALGERFGSYVEFKPIHDPTENMVAAQCLIFGGVLDRFPKLRVALLEGGAGWVPFWIDRLEEYYEEFLTGKLARGAPAEYLSSEQCYVSVEAGERTIAYVAETIGDDRLIFASDYLHHDARFPGSTDPIKNRDDLSQAAKDKILGENAKVLYRLED